MNLRPKLTYANVAATIALIVAIGGGTVYAATHLSKNSVKSKNIAPGAVRTADLGKNAVTSPKVKDGTITGADIAAGVLHNDIADVTGSATAGPVTIGDNTTGVPVPLSGTTTFTPQDNQVSALAAEGQFTYASDNNIDFCGPGVGLFVNGKPTRVFVQPPNTTTSSTPVSDGGGDADGPFGLLSPGTPITVTAQAFGDSHCSSGTKLDKLVVRIIQIH